ncbi:MAG: beta-propeller domain-containing protein [Methanomassiliicoccales archaeon]|nr:MAG: beta-propeller domain-containing protein [Methanomassiliicoccales archaeon]
MNLRKKMVLATIVVCMALLVNLNAGYGDLVADDLEYDGEPEDSFYKDYAVVKGEDGRLLLIPKENIEAVDSSIRPTRSSDSPFVDKKGPEEIGRFSSFEELRRYVGNHTYQYYGGYATGGRKVTEGTALGHSNTNVQVAGVDEGDIVKTDGDYAYIVSKDGGSVFIADVDSPEDAVVVSTVNVIGSIREIYVRGDTLIVLGRREVYQIDPEPDSLESQYCSVRNNGKKIKFNIGRFYYLKYIRYEATFIDILDIEDREKPSLLDSHIIRGSHLGSRMIGNHVYALTSSYLYSNLQEYDLPVPATDIYYLKCPDDPDYLDSYLQLTTILSIDIAKPSTIVDLRAVLMWASSDIYVSLNNIYITNYDYNYVENAHLTSIHRIAIDNGDILYGAYGEIEGTLLNRYSMDEYEGYFRAAVSIGFSSSNRVYVLDMDLDIVGCLEGIAPNEVLYSARFMGERLYLVTFRRIDPFFVIDLSDPENPEMLGELVLPGWSDYLHPYDEDHIIGLGRETDSFGRTLGVKLSLFDVVDVENPTEVSKFVMGDRYTRTIAADDPHAFLFSREENLLVIPVIYNYTVTCAYVFDITLGSGFELKGTVSHPRYQNPYGYYWYNYDSEIKRSFYIDDALYTLSNNYLQINDLNDLHEINIIELPNKPYNSREVQVMCIYIEPFMNR